MQKYSTFESLAVTFNPNIQPLLLSNLDKAYFSTAPTLFLTAETYGRDKALFWIKTQIMSIDFYNGTVKDGDQAAISELCNLILHLHSRLKLSELALFVARFKAGLYGKFYGAFDPIAIGEALKKFTKEREYEATRFASLRMKEELEARRYKPEENDGRTSLENYRHLKERAEAGDPEAIEALKPPHERRVKT